MIIYEADDPLVVSGVYDREGYKPGERLRIAKARPRVNEQEATMAKHKKASKKRVNGKTTRRGAAARKSKANARSPRSQVLPGMEQVRDRVLDELCESLGDCRDTMNASKVEEKGLIQSALKRMQVKERQVYKHARIALSREPGAERLRVRVVKEEGDADESDLSTGAESAVTDAEAGDAEGPF